jgi:glycerophosphoryl diester phosphodiesterase
MKMILLIIPGLAMILVLHFSSCTRPPGNHSGSEPGFYVIGHRGIPSQMPENTIPGMKLAIDSGANTIELDVHMTRDGQVVVYHDPSLNPAYTTKADGTELEKRASRSYILYQMDYEQIRSFDVGKKYFPAHPDQRKIAAYAPLLSELIDSIEAYTLDKKYASVHYLVEVKSGERTDGVEQPAPEPFMKMLMEVLLKKDLGNRLIIQSFDRRPLQVLHRDHPDLALGLLTGEQKSFEEQIKLLGFYPVFYNPHYSLVTPELVKHCHAEKIKICPWTVNDEVQMKKLLAAGVDGIISDYVNRVAALVR